MDWFTFLIVAVVVLITAWVIVRTLKSKPKGNTPHISPATNTNPDMMGARFCAVCGTGWKSTYGMMKDSGMIGTTIGSVGATFSPENLAGLTCSKCGKSFCKQHLKQKIPSTLPGGRCPSCRGKLNLA